MEHTRFHLIDKIAFINGLVTGVALYPQLIKVLFLKSTGDLSMLTFGVITLNSIVWIFYGIHRTAIPLVIASVLNAIAAGWLTFLAVIF